VDEKTGHDAGCQYIPLPQGGAIVTCPPKEGTGQVDSVDPYLGVGVVIVIILAVAFGLTLMTTRKLRKP